MEIGPHHPTSSFVLSSEALSFSPVIESVFPKLIRDIMCFSPRVPYIVLLLITKDDIGPATTSICMLEGIPDACRAEHSAVDSIW